MERNRKEAEKFSDLAKVASSPFLRAYYWNTASRYLSSEGELSFAQSDERGRILSAEVVVASKSHQVVSVAREPRISPASLGKGLEQRNDQASLAVVNQQRPPKSENSVQAVDLRTLEALQRLYRELHRVCISAENS